MKSHNVQRSCQGQEEDWTGLDGKLKYQARTCYLPDMGSNISAVCAGIYRRYVIAAVRTGILVAATAETRAYVNAVRTLSRCIFNNTELFSCNVMAS